MKSSSVKYLAKKLSSWAASVQVWSFSRSGSTPASSNSIRRAPCDTSSAFEPLPTVTQTVRPGRSSMLATGSSDMRSIRLWNVADGTPRPETFAGQVGDVWSLAFSPDGTRLASGTRDRASESGGTSLVTVVPAARRDILRMEFKRFLVSFIQIPCQIVATGRRLIYRILTYSRHLQTFLATFDHIRELKFT